MINIKIYLVLFLVFIFQFDQIFAAQKVNILKSCADYGLGAGEERCIVTDSDEWTCTMNASKTLIKGHCKTFPMSFDFRIELLRNSHHGYNEQNVMKDAEIYLHNHSKLTNTVFSSVYISNLGNQKYVVNGAYFDNNDFGQFALYFQKVTDDNNSRLRNLCYVMLVLLNERVSPSSDEATRESLYQKAFDLITPIYSAR